MGTHIKDLLHVVCVGGSKQMYILTRFLEDYRTYTWKEPPTVELIMGV